MRHAFAISKHTDDRYHGLVKLCAFGMGEERATNFVFVRPCQWTPVRGGTP